MLAEGEGIPMGKTGGKEGKVVRRDIETPLVVRKVQRQSREWKIKYSMCVWAHIWLIPEAVLSSGFSSCQKSDLAKKMKSGLQGKMLVVYAMG